VTRLGEPRRYQLTKQAVGVVRTHPWIFRSHLSSAAGVFEDGQWLRLVDGDNRVVGHGVYQARGAIAIRVLASGLDRPRGPAWLERVDAAIARRAGLRERTDGWRAIHGESDRVPAVVVEVLGGVVVVQTYAVGVDAVARLAARRVAAATGASGVLLRGAHRGATNTLVPRVLRGQVPDRVTIREDDLSFVFDPWSGQKGGGFLDLRGLRRDLATRDLRGARVLNLFAYTGMLGRACEHAGAASIVQVDASAAALAHAARHHVGDPARHSFVTADAFDWLAALPPDERFDVVIVDPPSMTSRADQVPRVLATYRKLFGKAATHVASGGTLVTACCTSRIRRKRFRDVASAAVGEGFAFERELAPEIDHPVGFPEADYLKIVIWRRTAG
jgi:23S rRNA G2069 N7-methylase RlmK/C1962 C5-methylase RlmI